MSKYRVVAKVTSFRCQSKRNWGLLFSPWKHIKSLRLEMVFKGIDTKKRTGAEAVWLKASLQQQTAEMASFSIYSTLETTGGCSGGYGAPVCARLYMFACTAVDFPEWCWALPWIPHQVKTQGSMWLESSRQSWTHTLGRSSMTGAYAPTGFRVPLDFVNWVKVLKGHLLPPNESSLSFSALYRSVWMLSVIQHHSGWQQTAALSKTLPSVEVCEAAALSYCLQLDIKFSQEQCRRWMLLYLALIGEVPRDTGTTCKPHRKASDLGVDSNPGLQLFRCRWLKKISLNGKNELRESEWLDVSCRNLNLKPHYLWNPGSSPAATSCAPLLLPILWFIVWVGCCIGICSEWKHQTQKAQSVCGYWSPALFFPLLHRACVILGVIFILSSLCIMGKAIHDLAIKLLPEVVRIHSSIALFQLEVHSFLDRF